MTISRRPRQPKYRRHKTSGQGFVEISGKRLYLGRFDLPETREKYHRLVAEWLAGGHQLPSRPADLTILELIDRFWTHVQAYYVGLDGKPTDEQASYRLALKPLRELFGHTEARDFGPKALQVLQGDMIRRGWSRGFINQQAGRIRRVFKWAVGQELVPAAVWHGLEAVSGLKAGRSDARETEPVGPVAMASVEAIRPHVSRQVWALVQLQLLTGARPGELLQLRPVDVDVSGKVWTATLTGHKTAWRGHRRTISFGPRSKAILAEFLAGRAVDAFLFSPAEAMADHQASRHAARVTPQNKGNNPGSNRVGDPEWQPGDCYTPDTYRRAIQRACDRAFPFKAGPKAEGESDEASKARIASEREAWQKEHRWHPHQLRHTAAVQARREFGPDAARALLGHRSLVATAIYAEVDAGTVAEIASKIG